MARGWEQDESRLAEGRSHGIGHNRARGLAWALEQGVTDGVWGGTTAEQRRAIRRLADIHPEGGFARDFTTADGERVRVAAVTPRQFADLTMVTKLSGSGNGVRGDLGGLGAAAQSRGGA